MEGVEYIMLDVIIINKEAEYTINNIAANLNISNSLDTLGSDVSLEVANTYIFEEGNIILLKSKGIEIFRGIILKIDSKGSSWSYRSLDLAFYLNENQVFFKFNTTATNCIKEILKSFNIPIGSIANISMNIKKIYNGEKASDVIRDILEQVKEKTDKDYYFEFNRGKFNLYDKASMTTEYIVNNKTVLSDLNYSKSIEKLKNTVVVTNGNEEDASIIHTVKDDNSISKFGKLQMVHKLEDDKKNDKDKIAKNLLKENNKVSKTVSFQVIGDFDLQPCKLIKVELKGIEGLYRIVSVSHDIAMGLHTTDLELEIE